MSLLQKIQQFVDLEEHDPRTNISIFGYYPYYGFRRVEFEKLLHGVGLARIKRKRPKLSDMMYRLILPLSGTQPAERVVLINGVDTILLPSAGDAVFGYFSGKKATVKLEAIRAICHIVAPFVSLLIKEIRVLPLRPPEKLRYAGDALYFLWIKKLISKIAPKEIFLTVSYSHYPIIAAAKALGIVTTEVQHGAISACHIGYTGKYIRYFPDHFKPIGAIWVDYLTLHPLPIDPSDKSSWISLAPTLSLDQLAVKYRGKSILIIGQETVHDLLYSVFEALVQRGLVIEYRFHPRVKSSVVSLADQIARADVVIGSYSTVLVDCCYQKEIVIVKSPASDFLDILGGMDNVFHLSLD